MMQSGADLGLISNLKDRVAAAIILEKARLLARSSGTCPVRSEPATPPAVKPFEWLVLEDSHVRLSLQRSLAARDLGTSKSD